MRDYGIDPVVWPAVSYSPLPGLPPVEIPEQECCLGLEKTVEAYIGHMVLVCRELRRVLRKDGVFFLNVGDSYASGPQEYKFRPNIKRADSIIHEDSPRSRNGCSRPHGLKPKDLCGVPWRLALALQADGWWLRSDIIWAKANPLPESVTDRPTKAHEYIFLLTKSAKYFWDMEAVREPHKPESLIRYEYGLNSKSPKDGFCSAGSDTGAFKSERMGEHIQYSGRNLRTVWNINTQSFPEAHFATFPEKLVEPMIKAGTSERGACPSCGAPWVRRMERKKHPTRDVEKQRIKAAIETGRTDGKVPGPSGMLDETRTLGWRPSCGCGGADMTTIKTPIGKGPQNDPTFLTGRSGLNRKRKKIEGVRPITHYEQEGYAKQLKVSQYCEEMRKEAGSAFDHYIRTDQSGARPIPQELLDKWVDRGWLKRINIPEQEPLKPIPCIVLDPFFGAGTSGLVAAKLGRDCIGIEIKPEYADMAAKRIKGKLGMLVEVEVE